MSFAPQPWIELPNLRASVALIVDDPAPCINPLWYFRHQVDGQASPAHAQTIPLAFMERWCRWVGDSKVRGDFTILPYPAGLGRIDVGLDGYDTGEVREWLRLAQSALMPQFDIHCEVLTHTRALDLGTGRLLPSSEQDWMAVQNEETLTDYFAAAMQILGDAGVPNHGTTQPCYFYGDEALYARALLAAEKRVNRRGVTHYFLHMDSVAPFVPPRLSYLDKAAGEAVVSIWTGTDDELWNTQDREHPYAAFPAEVLADRLLTADGQSGRLAALLPGGCLVLVTHWQSLFSNGTEQGFQTMQEVVRRVNSLWGARVAWRKLSDISNQYLAAQTAQLDVTATADTVDVVVGSPFGTDILTVSIPTPWPLYRGPQVWIDGGLAAQVGDASDLETGRWLMRGSVVTVSLALTANQPRRITLRASGGPE